MKKTIKITLSLIAIFSLAIPAFSMKPEVPQMNVLPEEIIAIVKEKFQRPRPEYIQELAEEIQKGEQYYESLGHNQATMPCGTSKGYILNNSLELISNFYDILANEFNLSADKYHEMFAPVIQSQTQADKNSSAQQFLTRILEFVWDGKLIQTTDNPDENYLINNLIGGKIKAFEAKVYHLSESTVNIDYSPSPYQLIKNLRDEIRQVNDKLYLGKAFYKGTYSDEESLFLYFALDFSDSPGCEKKTESIKPQRKELPSDYESWEACEKMNHLWDAYALSSKYTKLPPLDDADALGLFSMAVTRRMNHKMDHSTDVIPEDWHKPIHSKGSMAKVRFQSSAEHSFTGLYANSSCALMRLSLTNNPHQKNILKPEEKRGVAPGIAFKFFVDGKPSQDISVLTVLEGQGDNHNFFLENFSNIIPRGAGLDMKMVHEAFKVASEYPERLSVSGMSMWTATGEQVANPISPTQIFFVSDYKMSETENSEDIREKFHRIPKGTVLFKVYGFTPSSPEEAYKNYTKEQGKDFLSEAIYMGEIVTESELISSSFGDEEIFFKHKRFEGDTVKQ